MNINMNKLGSPTKYENMPLCYDITADGVWITNSKGDRLAFLGNLDTPEKSKAAMLMSNSHEIYTKFTEMLDLLLQIQHDSMISKATWIRLDRCLSDIILPDPEPDF